MTPAAERRAFRRGQLDRDRRAGDRVARSRHLRRRPAAHHRGAGRGDRRARSSARCAAASPWPTPTSPRRGRSAPRSPGWWRRARRPSEIRAAIGASFGEQVQLIPPASGFAGLVWILPVVVLDRRPGRRVGRAGPLAAHAPVVAHRRRPGPRRAGAPRPMVDAMTRPEADQREFLLRSLEDLEREHDAGDLDDADYAALKDDYTARAAAALRAEQAAAPPSPAPAQPRARSCSAGVAGLRGAGGVLVAQASGRRDAGDTATGQHRPVDHREAQRGGPLLQRGRRRLRHRALRRGARRPADQRRGPHLQGLGAATRCSATPRPPSSRSSRPPRPTRTTRTCTPSSPCCSSAAGWCQQASNELDRLDALDPPPDLLAQIEGLRAQVDAALAALATSTTAG